MSRNVGPFSVANLRLPKCRLGELVMKAKIGAFSRVVTRQKQFSAKGLRKVYSKKKHRQAAKCTNLSGAITRSFMPGATKQSFMPRHDKAVIYAKRAKAVISARREKAPISVGCPLPAARRNKAAKVGLGTSFKIPCSNFEFLTIVLEQFLCNCAITEMAFL